MESGQHDESSKESDKPDSGGRFYECTFCKQGFTTAQALGGHMNIHRRERARIRHPALPSPSITIQPTEEQRRPGISRPISTTYPQPQDTPINYHMYLPSSPSTSTLHPHPFTTDGSRIQRPRSLSLFEEDQSTNLSLGIGYAANEQGKKQEDEVDLELRLGHDP